MRLIRDGASLMIGRFLGVRAPKRVMDELVSRGRHLLGLRATDRAVRGRPGENALRQFLVSQRIADLKRAIPQGWPREALLRALLYIRMPDGAVDERGFNFLRRMREEAGKGISLATFKKAVREQFLMLQLDERRCIDAIPEMLAKDPKLAARFSGSLRSVVGSVG
jgi:hypothetical protein